MNLTDARAWVRSAVADGNSSSNYSDTDVDRAILAAGNFFCRVTKAIKRADTVALAEGDPEFDITTPIANGFRPERLIDATLIGEVVAGGPEALSVIEWPQLNAAQATDENEGTPQALAFIDGTTAEVWPTPNDDYSVRLRYWLPFTTFTPGTGSPGSVTLNIPDDYLPSVLGDGAAAELTAGHVKNKFGIAARERFLQYCKVMQGAGNLGAKVIYRARLD